MQELRPMAVTDGEELTTTIMGHAPVMPAEMQEVCVDVEHPKIAAHLDGIVLRLGEIPAEARGEIRRELRSHLENLVRAHEELGATHDEAVLAAIRQFGDTRRIVRCFRHAWHSTVAYQSPWAAMWIALRVFGLAMLSVAVPMFCVGLLMQCAVVLPAISPLGSTLLVYALFALPLIAGARVGFKAPRRAALGTFLALGALSIVTVPLLLAANAEGGAGESALLWALRQLCAFVGPCFVLWLPLGWLAALMAGTAKSWRGQNRIVG